MMKSKNDKIYLTDTQKDFLQYCKPILTRAIGNPKPDLVEYSLNQGYYYDCGSNQKYFNKLRNEYAVKYLELKKSKR